MNRAISLLLFLTLAGLGSSPALAQPHHGHGHGGHGLSLGLHFGFPFAWYGYDEAPPVVIAPPAPPVYVERDDVLEAPQNWWYYCEPARAYYPYVKTCPSGWQRVPPAPPAR